MCGLNYVKSKVTVYMASIHKAWFSI